MEVQHLRCFLAVAEELHFGRAADRLHLTPSPVSRNIKEFERELGVELFVRGYHSVELTEAGAELVDPVRETLRHLSQLRRTAQAASSRSAAYAVLRVGFSHVAHPNILEEVMGEVRRHQEDLMVEVQPGLTADLLPSLLEGDLDLAIAHLPVDHEDLEHLVVANYALVVAMRSDDELSERVHLTLDDLVGRTLVSQPLKLLPPSWAGRRHAYEAMGIKFRDVLMTDPGLTASYVRHHGELCLTTSFDNSVYEDPVFKVVPVRDPRAEWGAAVTWRRDKASDPWLGDIIKRLRDRFQGKPLEY